MHGLNTKAVFLINTNAHTKPTGSVSLLLNHCRGQQAQLEFLLSSFQSGQYNQHSYCEYTASPLENGEK